MGKFNVAIVLNDDNGSYQAWKKLFKDKEGNFSGWIQDKLLEEQEKQLDPNFIYNKLAEIENDKTYWENQLCKSKELQVAKEQQFCKEQPKTREQIERDFEAIIRNIGAALEYRFMIKDDSILFNHDFLEDLAIEYTNTLPAQKIDDFLKTKGFVPKVFVRREVTL